MRLRSAVRVPGGALDTGPGIKPNDAPEHSFPDAGPQDFWRKALARLYT